MLFIFTLRKVKICACHALSVPHAFSYPRVCHGEYPRVRQEPSGPSAGLTRPQHLCRAASKNNNSACGYKHGNAHQSTILNHFKLARSCSPLELSQRLFFSHYFLVDPRLVPTVTSKVQQSVDTMQAVFFRVSAALVFLLTGFPKSSHSQIAAGLRVQGLLMFCLRANLDIFKTTHPN